MEFMRTHLGKAATKRPENHCPMPKAVHVEEAKSGNAFKKFVNKCRTSGENLFRKVHPTKEDAKAVKVYVCQSDTTASEGNADAQPARAVTLMCWVAAVTAFAAGDGAGETEQRAGGAAPAAESDAGTGEGVAAAAAVVPAEAAVVAVEGTMDAVPAATSLPAEAAVVAVVEGADAVKPSRSFLGRKAHYVSKRYKGAKEVVKGRFAAAKEGMKQRLEKVKGCCRRSGDK